MKFAYYDRLTSKQKAIYRKSDALVAVGVPDSEALAPLVTELDRALSTGKRLATAKGASALVAALCQQLGAPTVRVTVRTVRPAISGGELHESEKAKAREPVRPVQLQLFEESKRRR